MHAAELIHLDLALAQTLSAEVSDGAQVVDVVTADGVRAVRDANLVVRDAGGRPLPAWMEVLALTPRRPAR